MSPGRLIKARLDVFCGRVTLALIGVSVGAVFGQATTKSARQWVSEINTRIASNDSRTADQGVLAIKAMLKEGQIPSPLTSSWLPRLVSRERHGDVAELAILALPVMPDSNNTMSLMEWRARALLALGKPGEALVAAKIAYNVCPMADTVRAEKLVGECVAGAKAGEAGKMPAVQGEAGRMPAVQGEAGRMPAVQGEAGEMPGVRGEAGRMPAVQGEAGRMPAVQGEGVAGTRPVSDLAGVLKGVRIDGGAFAGGLEGWSRKVERFGDRVKYGNMLLAADRGVEAEGVFRKLFGEERSESEHGIAAEGIARAMRAQDGSVGRGAAWLEEFTRMTASTKPAATKATTKAANSEAATAAP